MNILPKHISASSTLLALSTRIEMDLLQLRKEQDSIAKIKEKMSRIISLYRIKEPLYTNGLSILINLEDYGEIELVRFIPIYSSISSLADTEHKKEIEQIQVFYLIPGIEDVILNDAERDITLAITSTRKEELTKQIEQHELAIKKIYKNIEKHDRTISKWTK